MDDGIYQEKMYRKIWFQSKWNQEIPSLVLWSFLDILLFLDVKAF